VADYGVNIKVGVQNTQAITALTRKIKLTTSQVGQLNNFLVNFNDWRLGPAVVNSVDNFSKALKDARVNLNSVALGSKEATAAARDFARAQDLANDALREQAELLARVRNEGRSGTLRGGTQYGGPAGPGFSGLVSRQASETALRSPLPPSVPVALRSPMRPQSLLPQMGMTAQAGQIASDMEEVYASILRLTEKANQEEAQKLQTLRQGTQEVEALAQRYRTVTDANKTQKQLQLEIRRGVIETKQQAAKEAEIASRDYLNRLQVVEKVGKERRDQMILADRELATERKINAVFERRAQLAEKRDVQKRATGSALIGGAFPLLFGQGLGAAAGGAAGGFGGGMIGGEFGFGLSLVGTQIGTLIDQFIARATELGQALNPLTVDIDALTNAAGLAATETQKLIQQIEEEAGEKAALAAATSELALIVGLDGVDALREFGDGSLELSRQFSIAMTQMQSVLAKFLNSIGLGKGLAGAVEKTNLLRAGLLNTTDPELLRLQKERQQALTGATGAVAGVATIGIDKEIVERQRELQKENSEELKKQAKLAAQNNDEGLRQAGILRDRLTIEELGGSLLNDRVYGLERSIIFQEAALKAANDELTPLEKANIFRERDVELLRLANKRQAESERIANRKLRLNEKEQRAIDRRVKAVERELERTDKAFDRASSQLDDIINKHEDKMAFEREYSRLIQEGSTPAAAKQAIELKKQLLELDRQYTKLLEAVDAQILKTEASIADLKAQKGVTTEYEKQVKALEDLKKKREELEDKKGKAKGAIEKDLAPETGRDKIEAEMERVQGALNDLIDPANQVILAAQAIGDAFSESFKGLITGSMSAQEALANLFQRTADHFADMAAEMIAHAIKMQIFGIALNAFGGAAGAGAGDSFAGASNSTLDSVLPSTSSLADAAAATPLKLASGGYASGPTRALVGEGGQGEYIIPEGKMRESMARYSRGARGAAVVPSSGASGTSGESGGTAVAAPIDVRYTVERINSVDYVTADQFQRGMQQAAAQGATQGEQRALTTLRQNTSQRRRIGL
jgi:hypothetical protein